MKTIVTSFFTLLCMFAAAAKPLTQVKLLVKNNTTSLQDETTVFFDSTGTPSFSMFEDLGKVFNSSASVPQVYSLSSDSVACYSNAYGLFTAPVSISIGVRLDTAGYYTISASQISYFDAASMVLLEDRTTGNFYNLRTSNCIFYNTQAQFVIGRFVLHISYPPAITVTDADCNDLGGAINVYQEPTVKWTSCVAYDSVGYVMGTYTNINGNFTFTNLPEGNYTLAFTYGDYIAYKYVFVPGHKIEVSVSASTYITGVGQPVQFYSTTTNATIFDWNFGESTFITGVANPEMTYYQEGIFMVILECSNIQGCYAADTLIVKVGPATGIEDKTLEQVKVYAAGKNIVLQNLTPGTTNWMVSNIIGESVADGKTNNGNETISLYNQPNGVYIVTLNTPAGRLSRKVVVKE